MIKASGFTPSISDLPPRFENMVEDASLRYQSLLEVHQRFPELGDAGLGTTDFDVNILGRLTVLMLRTGGYKEKISRHDYLRHAFYAHWLVRWYLGGLVRVRLTQGLATQLAMTDCDGVEADEVRFPWDAFLIELPYPGGPLVFDGLDSVVDVRYLSAHKLDRVPHDAQLVVDQKLPQAKTEFDAMKLFADAKATFKSGFKRMLRLNCTGADSVSLYTLLPLSGPLDTGNFDLDFEGTPRDVACLSTAARILCNLALSFKYNPAIASVRGKSKQHDHGLSSLFYELGHDVKLSRELRQAARDACVAGSRPEGWEIAKRFVVRGHWKMQAHGVGRSERKRIFVAPYWKGPADAPAIARMLTDGDT